MKQSLIHVAVVVADYDDAIDFYVNTLGFVLLEDSLIEQQDKRWVLVAPPNGKGAAILLARASNEVQQNFVGDQAGGRVFLFLSTDDLWRDYRRYVRNGVKFVREPKQYDYGIVAVFEDLYGNRWDLIEHKKGHPFTQA